MIKHAPDCDWEGTSESCHDELRESDGPFSIDIRTWGYRVNSQTSKTPGYKKLNYIGMTTKEVRFKFCPICGCKMEESK